LTLISLDTVTAVRAREKKKKEKKKRRTVPARRDHFCVSLYGGIYKCSPFTAERIPPTVRNGRISFPRVMCRDAYTFYLQY
jgi:hypothetical protein